MTLEDERELLRLTRLLERLHERSDIEASSREALEKGALALSVAFIRRPRPEIERLYGTLGRPLSTTAQEHVRQLEIDPDGDHEG